VLSAGCALPLAAQIGYESGYEGLAGSAGGTALAGREGYSVPVTTPSSLDGAIYTYNGNTLSVPPLAFGQQGFLALVASSAAPSQVERPVAVPPDCQWHIEFDITVLYRGTSAPSGVIGAFSLQPSPGAASATLLARWPAGTTFPPTTWDADVVIGPGPGGTPVQVPDAHWHGLPVGLWNRWGCSVSTVRGEYTLFAIDNGITGVRSLYAPPAGTMPIVDPGSPPPTAFRLSALGADCAIAIDAISVAVHSDYVPYGAGCAGALGVPSLTNNPFTAPSLSTTFNVRLGGLPNNLAFFAMGFSNTASGPFALPLLLDGFGMPGCALLADPAALVLLSGTGGTAQWNLAIPGNPQFMGLHFYNQGFSLDPSANAAGLAASNAARACVGR